MNTVFVCMYKADGHTRPYNAVLLAGDLPDGSFTSQKACEYFVNHVNKSQDTMKYHCVECTKDDNGFHPVKDF